MTDKKPYTYTQEELNTAAQEENQEMAVSVPVLLAQKQHLSDRVVLLRAEVDRLTKALEGQPPRQPQDRQRKTAKKVAKKATSTRE